MTPRKILVVKLRAMGDTVILTAPLKRLREAFPKAEIHCVVSSPWTELLRYHPAVDEVWPYVRRQEIAARAKTITRLGLRLRQEKFDWAINFHASPSSAKLAFASGAKTRAVHFHGPKDKDRHSTVQIPDKGIIKPIVERDMDSLRALGLNIPEGDLPEIHLSRDERDWVDAYLKEKQLVEPILGLGLGASRPTKIWPLDRFAQLAQDWHESTGGSVVALGSPDEESLFESFQAQVKDAKFVQCIHDLTIRRLAALMSRFRALVGNDSGPKHLAVSMGTPTVTLIGPEHPYEWHPYPTDQHPYLFIDGLSCRSDQEPGAPPWCGLHTCVKFEHQCMQKIQNEDVFDELKRVGQIQ